MERVDLAIIGSGPAGVSAAITATVRKKSIILYGERTISEKVQKAHGILNYPGLPEITGADFAQKLLDHLSFLKINITDKRVNMVYAMGDYFMIQTADGQMQEANTVILATGMVQEKPLAGEDEYLGRGVSYCVTCDAMFYQGQKAAVIGYNEEALEEARFLASLADQVIYIPMNYCHKDGSFRELSTQIINNNPENMKVLYDAPKEIVGSMKVEALKTQKEEITLDGVFLIRDAIAPAKLVPGLLMDGNHVKVNLQMETNLPGLFACGDIAGTPYQYVKAAGQGNVAALQAVSYLATKK